MTNAKNLKTIHKRNIKALKLRPSIGRGTATTRVRVRSGLTCDIEDGEWTLVGDEMPGDGGAGLGPDPGVFARAALGSCLAMGYVYWAALQNVEFDSIEVQVDADYDANGFFGVDDSIPPGFDEVRYSVTIASAAPKEKIEALVEEADRYSSILDVFRRALRVKRDLRITSPVAE